VPSWDTTRASTIGGRSACRHTTTRSREHISSRYVRTGGNARLTLEFNRSFVGYGRVPRDVVVIRTTESSSRCRITSTGIVWISARQTTGLGATVGASRPPIRGTASPPDCVLSSDGSLASVDGSPLHSESARTFAHVQRGGLRDLVASFKTTAALAVNKIRRTPGARVWQRSYYDHIIRSEQDLRRVREYIRDNPRKWAEDPDNPINICRA